MTMVSESTTMRVRGLIADLGGTPTELTSAQINEVVRRCGCPELAATALTMLPRPGWVAVIVPKDRGLPR